MCGKKAGYTGISRDYTAMYGDCVGVTGCYSTMANHMRQRTKNQMESRFYMVPEKCPKYSEVSLRYPILLSHKECGTLTLRFDLMRLL